MITLVTGAGGFLGSHVVDALVAQGERPRAMLRPGESTSAIEAAGADIRIADVADRPAIEAVMAGVDRVLHCAARTGPWGQEREYVRANVTGLENVVRAALAAGVRRIVHVSSITVLGNDIRGSADETSPLRTEPNPYSRSKVAGERLLQRMISQNGAPVTIVRPGWIYGPRDTASFARLASKIEAGQMAMVGSGRNHLPLIYVTDAARGIVLASEAERAAGRTYLLVGDSTVTQRDYLAAIAAELGVKVPGRRVPYRLTVAAGAIAELAWRVAGNGRQPPVMRYGMQLLGGENRFRTTRAATELGFSPSVSLSEGVRHSVEWYRATQSDRARTEVSA